MTSERYQQVGKMYRDALEIDAEQWPAYLEKACAQEARKPELNLQSH